jgi:uncharacterized protein (TIGR03435 family)
MATSARDLLLLMLPLVPVCAQSPARPAFEVASIKPTKSSAWIGVGGCMTPEPSRGPCPGRFYARGANVKMLIEYAYHVRRIAIAGGPGWIGSSPDLETTDAQYLGHPPAQPRWDFDFADARFDIEAKAEIGATEDRFRMMLQGLLEDRFQLKVHREMRDLPHFELVVANGRPKLKEAAECGPAEINCGVVRRRLQDVGFVETARRISMSGYAEYLAGLPEYLGIARPVLNKTDLAGLYDFTIEFSPGPPYTGPSLFTALEEQLGLKLESKRGLVEVFVIDHVERPSEN